MQIVFEGLRTSGNTAFDTDIRFLEAISDGSGGISLVAATGGPGGVSAYSLDSGGALDFEGGRPLSSGGAGSGGFSVVETGNGTWLVAEGSGDGGLMYYPLNGDAAPGGAELIALPGAAAGPAGPAVSAALPGGQTALYAVDSSGTLRGWLLDGSGGAAASGASFQRPGIGGLAVAGAGPQQVLLAADEAAGALVCYRIAPDTGALAIAGEFGAGEGLPVSGEMTLATAQAHGSAWAVAAASGTGSLSLFEVSASGSLTLHDHVTDTGTTRFGGTAALTIAEAVGHVFVLAAGADDGLSIFRLLPGGALLHAVSIPHTEGSGLENVTALEVAEAGGRLHIFAASGTSGGIAQFSIDLDGLGLSATAPGGSAAVLTGTGDGDLLCGSALADTLRGGAGDDTLAAGSGGGELTGGAGRDLFAAAAGQGSSGALLTIADFTPGEDRLDLSALPGLRSVSQLAASQTGAGLLLEFGGAAVLVMAADGGILETADIWPAGFEGADHWQITAPSGDGRILGTMGADNLQGSTGSDTIEGLDGADSLSGFRGNDTLEGGQGDDWLFGGEGNDLLDGGYGADVLDGGYGNDRLSGGLAADTLSGGNGADTLTGGWDADVLTGARGTDKLIGNEGSDLLSGGEHADYLHGGSGDDSLEGGSGQDTLKGGSGDDKLEGNDGDDRLTAGEGKDTLNGGAGHDSLNGQDGSDTLRGGSGDDRLEGGKGGDRLYGGEGQDKLKGQKGHDVMKGGSGGDQLNGGPGADTLNGGSGADVFIFAPEHGKDLIQDFLPGTDILDLSRVAGGLPDLDFTAADGGTVIRTAEGEVMLSGITPGSLDADDFLFG